MYKFLILLSVFSTLICNDKSSQSHMSLLDETLSQFEKKGGDASYELSDGVLTGVAAWSTPNTFLCTKAKYKNFILGFSVKVDPRLNSGVQIRSQTFMDQEGYEMLKGYQVEIDPSDRAWSGGIYEERDRGWIGNLADNPEGRKAFKNGAWNDYHVEAIDNQIRVWVNGINTVNLLDDQSEAGIIGLQVHAIYEEEHIGATVQWKDIKLTTSDLASYRMKENDLAPEINLIANHLSASEISAGWVLLQRDNINIPPPGFDLKPWNFSNQQICSFDDTLEPLALMSMKGDFELKFEYQLSEGGRGTLEYGYVGEPYAFAIADDAHLDKDIVENIKAGSIKDIAPAQNLSNPDRAKALRSHDQWSQVHIITNGNNIKHWLNNNLVIDTTINDFSVAGKQRLLRFRSNESQLCLRSIKVLN